MPFFKNSNLNHHPHNQKQQQQQNQTRAGNSYHKSNKKTDKTKRTILKTESKKSLPDLDQDQPPPTTSSSTKTNYSNRSSTNFKSLAPTKVKSCSWKRSDKQVPGFNAFSNKTKTKSLRKKSPTWLKFHNSTVKLNEVTAAASNNNEPTSVCRPGTLYSDVLFGAGSSCLVKVKNLTPRRSTNTAQKKLNKAFFKYTGNDNELSDESEIETERNAFPSLQKFSNKTFSSSSTCSEHTKTTNSPETISISPESPLGIETTITASPSPTKCNLYEEADVVILSQPNDRPPFQNEVSYGNYLEQHFNGNGNASAAASQDHIDCNSNPMKSSGSSTKSLLIDIPKWNFIDADISSDAFPKFLCQFNDENYLKAENMALLGLKLALGNNSQQNKFKF